MLLALCYCAAIFSLHYSLVVMLADELKKKAAPKKPRVAKKAAEGKEGEKKVVKRKAAPKKEGDKVCMSCLPVEGMPSAETDLALMGLRMWVVVVCMAEGMWGGAFQLQPCVCKLPHEIVAGD